MALKVSRRSGVSPFIALDVLRHANEREAAGGDVLHLRAERGTVQIANPHGVRSTHFVAITGPNSAASRADVFAIRRALVERAILCSRRHGVRAEQLGPPENRVQRRAKLVRQGGQEFVFHAVRLAFSHEQFRAFLLGTAPLADLAAQLLVRSREFLLAKLDPLEHAVERVDQGAQLVFRPSFCPEGVVAA